MSSKTKTYFGQGPFSPAPRQIKDNTDIKTNPTNKLCLYILPFFNEMEH